MFNKYRTQILQAKLQREQLKTALLLGSFRPSFRWPVMVYNQGGRWVCSFECSSDPMENVVAFGDSPEQACANFDALWEGNVPILEEPEEDEIF